MSGQWSNNAGWTDARVFSSAAGSTAGSLMGAQGLTPGRNGYPGYDRRYYSAHFPVYDDPRIAFENYPEFRERGNHNVNKSVARTGIPGMAFGNQGMSGRAFPSAAGRAHLASGRSVVNQGSKNATMQSGNMHLDFTSDLSMGRKGRILWPQDPQRYMQYGTGDPRFMPRYSDPLWSAPIYPSWYRGIPGLYGMPAGGPYQYFNDCVLTNYNPNDCRSCVIANGGDSIMADAVCGPMYVGIPPRPPTAPIAPPI